jgi:hypothetical protein
VGGPTDTARTTDLSLDSPGVVAGPTSSTGARLRSDLRSEEPRSQGFSSYTWGEEVWRLGVPGCVRLNPRGGWSDVLIDREADRAVELSEAIRGPREI